MDHAESEVVSPVFFMEEDYVKSEASFDNKESIETEGKETLARLEIENTFLDKSISERYGSGFLEKLRTRSALWSESLKVKGDRLLEWAEEKGVPMPESKRGMRIASAASGVAGAIVPGLGFLLPVSYILWQRSAKMEENIDGSMNSLKMEGGIHYA